MPLPHPTATGPAALALLAALTAPAPAQTTPSAPPAASPATAPTGVTSTAQPGGDGTMLLTVFLRHDQSKTLKEINETLQKNGYYDRFPPAGVEVVSWYVVMGIGQVVTLRFPAERLRDVNVALENTAWGPYRTDFYPTYDYKAIAEQQKQTLGSRPR